MSLRLEEIPYEFEGKTYMLRANMAVLEAIQEAHGGNLDEVMESANPIGSVMEFLAAMLNDYADEQGWPERFTKKQVARKFSMADLTKSGLVSKVMGLVIRSMTVPTDAGEDPAEPDAQPPESTGN